MHQEDEGFTFDMDMDLHSEMIVTYLAEGQGYGVAGSGNMTAVIASVSPQGRENGQVTISWTTDVTTSEFGCPLGTATVTTQQWQMAVVYDGEGGAAWTMIGPNYQGQGTEVLDCTVEL